jgi:hypothetical protein
VSDVTFDPTTHQYSRGLQTLTSITQVIRTCWPVRPSWDTVDPAVIENARERGIETDELFSGWINGTLTKIPAGTREDAVERFMAVRSWWLQKFGDSHARAQVILADDELAGCCDVLMQAGSIWDLKNTAAIETSYPIQLGGYADLHEKEYGRLPHSVGVIHVTKPKDRPVSVRLIEFDVAKSVSEWRLLRSFWTMTQRYAKPANREKPLPLAGHQVR